MYLKKLTHAYTLIFYRQPALPHTAQAVEGRQFYTDRRRVGGVAVKIAAHRDFQLKILCQALELCDLVAILPPADNLQRLPTGLAKISDQAPQLHPGEAVLHRVCQHRDTTGGHYPLHCLGHSGPAGLDVSGFALAQVAIKGLIGIFDQPLSHHPGREMGPPQLAFPGLGQGACQRTGKASGLQSAGDDLSTLGARRPQYRQGLAHGGVVTVHGQPNNMHGNARPHRRQLHPGDDPRQLRAGRQLAISGYRIVIGERKQLDASFARALQQFIGGQCTVGGLAVGVEVYAHNLYTLGPFTRPLAGPAWYHAHPMKQLLEFLPIALFFIVYQMNGDTVSIGSWSHTVDGIFSATAVLMIATLFQVAITYLLTRELEKRLLWLAAAVLVFGGATLAFRNEAFIQWKPTVFNWTLALAFGGSQFFGEKTLMERALGSQIVLPRPVWTRLNLLWVANFAIVGALNLVVAYNFSEATWVSYKLYSAIGFTLVLTIITAVMISPHLKEDDAVAGDKPQ